MKNTSTRNIPDINRLSQLAAMIMLAYLIGRFVNLPIMTIDFQIFSTYFKLNVNIRTIITIIVGLLVASGADWLIQEHPALNTKLTIEHWVLPALATWVISVPMYRLQLEDLWWIGFLGGSTLIMLVLIAEYIVVDANDTYWLPAAISIKATLFALLLTLAIAMRAYNLRLYLLLPLTAISTGLVSFRTIKLQESAGLHNLHILITIIIVSQFATALHYLPLSPIQFGIALTGIAYALTTLMENLVEQRPLKNTLSEPAVLLTIIVILTIWIH